MKLLIATTNQHKMREIRAVFAKLTFRAPDDAHELVSLADVPPVAQPEERGKTFWENARAKALAYARASGLRTVAEDSGLELAALGGEPGVRSARFLGSDASYPARFEEIYRRLRALGDAPPDARFVTALAVADPDGTLIFETETAIDGTVADRPAGTNGFGYDPIFWYAPLRKTTGEMTLEEKSTVSHRARAFRNFARWLRHKP